MKETIIRNSKEKAAGGNGITELVFILDRSGSMQGLESDSAGGFNSVINEQKKKDGRVWVSTVLFNDHSKVLHDRVDINGIEPMKTEDYIVGGCTALLDALGDAIHHIGNVHKYARKEDVPENTIFVIMTDGMENASRRYSARDIKEKISRQTEKYGWEFLFLGANIDAVGTAASYGIDAYHSVTFECDREGIARNYAGLNEAVGSIRAEKCLSPTWADGIREHRERKSKIRKNK